MKTLRAQFEIRYKPILGFDVQVPKVIAPIQRIGGDLMYEEVNNGAYILVFNSDSYLIDIRNDRIIFMTSSDINHYTTTTGPFNHFINAYDKIKEMEGFVIGTSMLYAEWMLLENENDFEENRNLFANRYFDSKIASKSTSDIAITFDFQDGTLGSKVTTGPFNPKTDIEKYKLKTPFTVADSSFEGLNGILFQSVISDTIPSISIEKVRELIQGSQKVIKEVNLF